MCVNKTQFYLPDSKENKIETFFFGDQCTLHL